MAWFKCVGSIQGGDAQTYPILTNAQISTVDNGGSYIYPTYSDLLLSDYDIILVKIKTTDNNIEYERLIGFTLKDVSYRQSSINLFDSQGNSLNINMEIEFSSTGITPNVLSYSGSLRNIYIDMIGIKLLS